MSEFILYCKNISPNITPAKSGSSLISTYSSVAASHDLSYVMDPLTKQAICSKPEVGAAVSI